jgi:hypothetical protein
MRKYVDNWLEGLLVVLTLLALMGTLGAAAAAPRRRGWQLVLGVLLVLVLPAWAAVRLYRSAEFDRNCQDHLAKAAVALYRADAQEELGAALAYLRAKGIDGTSGHTAIFGATQDTDVGAWYGKVGDAHELLSQPTSTNSGYLLSRVREYLTERDGKGGTQLATPPGISVYPHNRLYAFWGVAGFIAFLVGLGLISKYVRSAKESVCAAQEPWEAARGKFRI